MKIDSEMVERENRYALTAIQALLGLIGPTVEAVALTVVRNDEIVLHFWARGKIDEVNEDAVDVQGDMVALLWPETETLGIKIEVLSSSPPREREKQARYRFLYWSKYTPSGDD